MKVLYDGGHTPKLGIQDDYVFQHYGWVFCWNEVTGTWVSLFDAGAAVAALPRFNEHAVEACVNPKATPADECLLYLRSIADGSLHDIDGLTEWVERHVGYFGGDLANLPGLHMLKNWSDGLKTSDDVIAYLEKHHGG